MGDKIKFESETKRIKRLVNAGHSCAEKPSWYNPVVYFIQAGKSGLIKIGFTGQLLERFYDLQVNSPEELYVLKTIPGDGKKERELHRRFANERVRGEWFEPTEELLKFIEAA